MRDRQNKVKEIEESVSKSIQSNFEIKKIERSANLNDQICILAHTILDDQLITPKISGLKSSDASFYTSL